MAKDLSTEPTGSDVSYKGNIGNPYGSNIIEVSPTIAEQYKYVAMFRGSQKQIWTVAIWNKIGPDGALDGWYGRACKTFILTGDQTRYIAFDEDSQGAWAAAPGFSIPIDSNGGYASTWGEFDFGSTINSGWSGFDVSAIAAQSAGLEVQGMKICDDITGICSSITANAASVNNAYTYPTKDIKGIGGNLWPGPVSLTVTIGYNGKEAA
ncbi:Allergen [Penicillium sp. IBT 18751x]|nr:Allergen [Penicillium sp. IBT 18751x]